MIADPPHQSIQFLKPMWKVGGSQCAWVQRKWCTKLQWICSNSIRCSLLQRELLVPVEIAEVARARVIFWIPWVKHQGLHDFRPSHQLKWLPVSLQETDYLQQQQQKNSRVNVLICTSISRKDPPTDFILGLEVELWWMHKDATASVYTISSGSYSLPREGSTSSWMLFASSSGFAFIDDQQFVNSRVSEACSYDVHLFIFFSFSPATGWSKFS